MVLWLYILIHKTLDKFQLKNNILLINIVNSQQKCLMILFNYLSMVGYPIGHFVLIDYTMFLLDCPIIMHMIYSL